MRLARSWSRAVLAALALTTGGRAAAQAPGATPSTLTFEDLCYHAAPQCAFVAPTILFPGGPIVTSYRGFSLTNFRPLDLLNYPLSRPDPDPAATGRAGYPFAPATYGNVLGLSFGTLDIRRPVGNGGFALFQFDDMLAGSGWTEPTTLAVTGLRGGQTIFSLPSFALLATSTSTLDLPNLWVDELVLAPNFTPPGFADPYGSAAQNGGTPFMSFWIDNVDYQVTPEPSSIALVAGGLAALGLTGLSRRRRR